MDKMKSNPWYVIGLFFGILLWVFNDYTVSNEPKYWTDRSFLYFLFNSVGSGFISVSIVALFFQKIANSELKKSIETTFKFIIDDSFKKLYFTQSDDEISRYEYDCFLLKSSSEEGHLRQLVNINYKIKTLPKKFYIVAISTNNHSEAFLPYINDPECIFRWWVPENSDVFLKEVFTLNFFKVGGATITPKIKDIKDKNIRKFYFELEASDDLDVEFSFESIHCTSGDVPVPINPFLNKNAGAGEFRLNVSDINTVEQIHASPAITAFNGVSEEKVTYIKCKDNKTHSIKVSIDKPFIKGSSVHFSFV